MASSSPISARTLGRLGLVGAGLVALQALVSLFQTFFIGMDFLPLRHAGHAIVHGSSIYADKNFVYPPTAAPLFIPLAYGSAQMTYLGYLIISVLGLFAAAGLIARLAPDRRRILVFALAALVLVASPVASGSLFLGNLSVLLVPFGVLILIAFHRERWLLGCALLVLTLLIKPLFAPLLLVPVVRRRWVELVRTAVPGLLALLLAMSVVPGGRDFGRVLSYCLGGTNLHGGNAVNNLSLRGWVEAHGLNAGVGTAASALLIAAVLARLIGLVRRHGWLGVSPLQWANLVLLTTMLAGRISEVHFLLCVLAGVLLQLVVEGSYRNAMLALPGLIMLGLPQAYLGLVVNASSMRQSWLVLAELLLLAAVLARSPASVSARLEPPILVSPALVPA